LLHCMAGILRPDAGEIHVGGRRIDTLDENRRSALRRDRFGFVFQFGQLVPELTAEENVALPLLLGGVRRSQALSRAQVWFERLDLPGLQHRRSGELSGGQAQRVALTGEQVMDLLVASARDEGTTVVLVTHDARVAAYADREIIVRDGKVAVPDLIDS
jgi:putative ABC transport system ATP-binding protein